MGKTSHAMIGALLVIAGISIGLTSKEMPGWPVLTVACMAVVIAFAGYENGRG